MKTNEILREQVLQVVENQLKDNKPPETKQTYDRLVQSGISDADARIYIGQCVAVEIFNIMKHGKPFDAERYTRNLNNLPKQPFD